MIAMINKQGTACSETGLCNLCDTPYNRILAVIRSRESIHDKDPAILDSWIDCNDNMCIQCIICGTPGEGLD